MLKENSISLRCNKCWQLVDSSGFVTSCNHVLCEKDAQKFVFGQSICPACSRRIEASKDAKCIEKVLKSINGDMDLWSLHPSQVLEVSKLSIAFYVYQKEQEAAYWQFRFQRTEDKRNSDRQLFETKARELEGQLNVRSSSFDVLQEKYHALKKAFDQLKHEARDETRRRKNYEDIYHREVSKVDQDIPVPVDIRPVAPSAPLSPISFHSSRTKRSRSERKPPVITFNHSPHSSKRSTVTDMSVSSKRLNPLSNPPGQESLRPSSLSLHTNRFSKGPASYQRRRKRR